MISGKTTSGGLSVTNHFQYPGGVRTRWSDDVYVTWILGTPEVFVAFLTTYCVGNLIGSALAKPLTDWKCKVTIFWWTNALLAVISLAMFFVPMQASITMFVFIFVIGVCINW
ncbi:putative carbohydrate transporter [Escherichia coli]|uniref:Putative carbohydrate transporter n=1 Tax=Escherichia coli TaxID=562 RepID=A0A376V9U1_ECOLX|nr:putative carbohydrate transporter [Escherichia coli]